MALKNTTAVFVVLLVLILYRIGLSFFVIETTTILVPVPSYLMAGIAESEVNRRSTTFTIAEKAVNAEIPYAVARKNVTATSIEAPMKESSIEASIEECLTRSHLNSQPLLKHAKENARYYYNEFRRAIPSDNLGGYKSYCWKENYIIRWNSSTCSGILGNMTFSSDCWPYTPHVIPYMLKAYLVNEYRSNLVCLPNLFLAGFPKSGSTFVYHFINNLISMSTNDWGRRQVEKETQFWVRFYPYRYHNAIPLNITDLGSYFLNFVPGIQKISELKKTNTPLIEGTPNIVMDFPRFKRRENNLTNYCLIPTVLPRLLPDSKYIFVMRNPIDMLYSGFWFSCSRLPRRSKISKRMIKRGPQVFHERIVSEIDNFNMCMRNLSEPSISEVCKMEDKDDYASCIRQRLHLLDKCSAKITHHIYSQALPHCGEVRLYTGIYYVHLRKWLHLVERDRMLFFTLDEFNVNNIVKVAHEIVRILGLDADPTIITKENVQNATVMNEGEANEQTRINYKDNPSLKMRNSTKSILEIFYHPFNSLLAKLVDDNKFKWF